MITAFRKQVNVSKRSRALRGKSTVKIKICGITNIEDAVCACNLGADALGFVFYSKSPRYVNPHLAEEIISRLNPDFALGFEKNGLNPCQYKRPAEQKNRSRIRCNTARTLLRAEHSSGKDLEACLPDRQAFCQNSNAKSGLDKRVKKIGVFVNAEANYVKKIASMCKLDMLQFHGDESPSFCSEFPEYKIIKAFRIKDRNSFKDISRYEKACPAPVAQGGIDYYLFDSFKKGFFGGTGKRFQPFLFKDVKINKPFFLSGGLNPRNVRSAISLAHPDWVDVSSGVESSVGKKDIKLLKEFIEAVRSV